MELDRHDVPYVHAEDVGPLLFEERRALAGRDGLLELLLRRLPLADLGPDAFSPICIVMPCTAARVEAGKT